MLANINQLQDKANAEIAKSYFWQSLLHLQQTKKINERQFTLIEILLDDSHSANNLSSLKSLPAYKGLYHNRTSKTQDRDLKILQQLGLLEINADKNISISQAQPSIILSSHPFCKAK